MAKFFIDRPIFAWVIAIIIMLAGSLAITQLPVEQYPQIAPPSVQINATYPGATAETLEESVTQIIEQNLNGIDNLQYFSSTSDSAGNTSITLTFAAGTDPDIAQVQVQNKIQLVVPLLPQAVQDQGIVVAKSNDSFLMVLALVSDNPEFNQIDLGDYIASNIQDPIARTPGVGNVQLFGSPYAMRIWLDPQKLTRFNLTTEDVVLALREQNNQVAAGRLGGTPAVDGQRLTASIIAQTRLESVEQFEKILLRVNNDGSAVTIADVAHVELGGQNYGTIARYNRQAASGIAINLATGANALDTAAAVKETVADLEQFFPPGVELVVPYDTTPFVEISITEVVKILFEAVVLVFLLMFIFLQNLRATLIPALAIPVVLLGTFGIMSAFGFTINTLTMFGIVLAIGLLVDDAIVVVENVERLMSEEKLSPRKATIKSMKQITGALIAIGLVMAAVFVPMAFFGGSTGAVYRQFSITIISAMALSVLVAIIFSPALCATLLKPVDHEKQNKGLLGAFNRGLNRLIERYTNSVQSIIKRSVRFVFIYLALVIVLGIMFLRMPSSFIPDEDRGVFLTQMQLPSGATQEQSFETMQKIENYYLDQAEGIRSVFSVVGFSFSGQGQNSGLAFVRMTPWSERTSPELQIDAIIGRAMGHLSQIREAMIFAFNLPSIPALGNATGFNLYLQDRGGLGHEALLQARNQLLGMAGQQEELTGVRPNGLEDTSQFRIEVDFQKAKALGLSISSINATLSSAFGSTYVNDFIDRGRVKQVYIQGKAESRMDPEDLEQWYVRNDQGEMVPFSAFASSSWSFGPQRLERYNGVPAMNIQGQAAEGYASGAAMMAMERLISQLPEGIGFEWTGISLEERKSGDQAPLLYALSLLIVFLCLAALYESWSIPFAVMLVVPLGILGAVIAATMRGLENDVYFQVGLLTTVGVSSRNAILIVEFAKDLQAQGKELLAATLEAVRLRLRPILMTSLAFTFGVLPLALSTGAGAVSRQAIGTGVIGGMLGGTILAIFFVPLLFYIVRRTFPPKVREED
ncbi:efflux RND transporter permease subunit [Pseudidiomarina sp. 1APP75-32.1]|uniref:Efflux pump membrane transporter n=1 Tax=Pseudidiomarina terrestris TaxID=2820060 RepID=A0AAW7QVI4_9GAMM|nr:MULTISPECIES: efflux RND transporter permease subunit [unclassified Pseudidiomarina]MDN7123764.1 efflux RND transporter permease subunit [Pseudidiomarina sp. 1APP75-32.1]MDN7126422.1 efflux RND transporter permease subunit [Pseudidiomarina sp. 1APR75-33.1]MDN7137913.1 efflux RND transporter permease subunit [Pseudidiomarina sp. 1ASP75-14]